MHLRREPIALEGVNIEIGVHLTPLEGARRLCKALDILPRLVLHRGAYSKAGRQSSPA